MKIIRVEDAGHVTNITCQHPSCKKRPKLRFLYHTDNGLIIGSSCKNKCENAKQFEKPKIRKTTIRPKTPSMNQPTLMQIFRDNPQNHSVTPHLLLIENKRKNEEEYL